MFMCNDADWEIALNETEHTGNWLTYVLHPVPIFRYWFWQMRAMCFVKGRQFEQDRSGGAK